MQTWFEWGKILKTLFHSLGNSGYPAICVPKIVYLSAALIAISLLENRAYF